jgi:hypothetical protein
LSNLHVGSDFPSGVASTNADKRDMWFDESSHERRGGGGDPTPYVCMNSKLSQKLSSWGVVYLLARLLMAKEDCLSGIPNRMAGILSIQPLDKI